MSDPVDRDSVTIHLPEDLSQKYRSTTKADKWFMAVFVVNILWMWTLFGKLALLGVFVLAALMVRRPNGRYYYKAAQNVRGFVWMKLWRRDVYWTSENKERSDA